MLTLESADVPNGDRLGVVPIRGPATSLQLLNALI
jgi:hypothetical protein